MAVITERRRLTPSEKRRERVFEDVVLTRRLENIPEYEVAPVHKSYLDLGVQTAERQARGETRIFNNPDRRYEYEPAACESAAASERTAESEEAEEDAPPIRTRERERETLYPRGETYARESVRESTRAAANVRTRAPRAGEDADDDNLRPTELTMRTYYDRTSSGAVKIDERRYRSEQEAAEYYGEGEETAEAHITLNRRGKITVAAYIAVILVMFIIAIVTASGIASLSAETLELENALSAKSGQITALENALTPDEAAIARAAGGADMYIPTQSNGGEVSFTLPELAEESVYKTSTNFFDAVCRFFSSLF